MNLDFKRFHFTATKMLAIDFRTLSFPGPNDSTRLVRRLPFDESSSASALASLRDSQAAIASAMLDEQLDGLGSPIYTSALRQLG